MMDGVADALAPQLVEKKADDLIYRFVAELTEVNAVGLLPEGLRMANAFAGEIVEGPLKGSRIWGVDPFLLRPDGVGVVDAPETISSEDRHIQATARGYAIPPEGMEMPPLEALLAPDFVWPELDFRFTGCVLFRTADTQFEHLNRTVGVLSGTVNMGTRLLEVTARAAA
ncbi:MAG TPA: hypothetical protein VKA63_02690 [Candidatus Krumholzibacteria bacterium]|nr:hypothetical protein [Candidatus Krumholzibacteria bacterium]